MLGKEYEKLRDFTVLTSAELNDCQSEKAFNRFC